MSVDLDIPIRKSINEVEEDQDSSDDITYPSGFPPQPSAARVTRERLPVPSKRSSLFFIGKQYDSLDYIKVVNQLEVEKEKDVTFGIVLKEDHLRSIIFMLTGVLTAVVGIIVATSITILGDWKYEFVGTYVENYYNTDWKGISIIAIVWFLSNMIPVLIGSSLVVFIAPFAAGGGVAQCIGYLNGVRVPNVLSIKGLLVKMSSTTMTCISGIAGGKEGPMMHMGATLGGSLPSILPWKCFRSDYERRDLAAAGLGAGIAVAFGAPIGGLLLALEEGISFWDFSLMWNSFLCILTSYFVSSIAMSFVEHDPGNLVNPFLLTLGKITTDVTDYELFELVLFMGIAVIASILAVITIRIHICMTLFRRRFVTTRIRKLLEALMVAFIYSALSIIAVFTVKQCSADQKLGVDEYENMTRHTHQLDCKEGEYNEMALVFFQTQEGFIHSMFSKDVVQSSSLFIFCLIYYLLIHLTMGIHVSCGLFVPQIVFGAAWGRIIGNFLQSSFPHAKWARPAKYAYIAATAQLSALVGKTFSILVIMTEASASTRFGIPLMVAVSITRALVSAVVMPIYETQMHMIGIPFLPSDPPPVSHSILTTDVMSASPLVTFTLMPTVKTILDVLQSTGHNGFPIVLQGYKSGGIQVGLILRQQLLVLLLYKAYKYPPPQTGRQMRECQDLYLKHARKQLKLEKIKVKPKYYGTFLDLTPYYNPFPYVVSGTMPLTHAYTMFRSLGLRHLIVIDLNNEPIGMVTRKDLAKYHTWNSLCKKGVKQMELK